MANLADFEALKTHHCVTGSLRHVYVYHGCPVSEELLLGLGAGVGFVYWHTRGGPPFLGGRGNVGRPGETGMESLAGRRTGVEVHIYTTGSAGKAEKALLAQLEAGEPVMMQVDMGYLPYFDFPEEYHFGGHVIVIAGYDATQGQVLAADREGVLYPLALADLARARASQYPPFAPHHKWYTFDFSGFRSPASHEVWAAIGETAQAMLHPPIANLGVRGIHTARQRTLRWPREMDAGALKAACFNVYIMIDATGGTGGGLFRYMYARFLDEAAALTGEARLAAVGRSFALAGDRWQDVALGFREAAQAPDPAQCIEAAGWPLEEIAALEEAAWAELDGLVRERQSS